MCWTIQKMNHSKTKIVAAEDEASQNPFFISSPNSNKYGYLPIQNPCPATEYRAEVSCNCLPISSKIDTTIKKSSRANRIKKLSGQVPNTRKFNGMEQVISSGGCLRRSLAVKML